MKSFGSGELKNELSAKCHDSVYNVQICITSTLTRHENEFHISHGNHTNVV